MSLCTRVGKFIVSTAEWEGQWETLVFRLGPDGLTNGVEVEGCRWSTVEKAHEGHNILVESLKKEGKP